MKIKEIIGGLILSGSILFSGCYNSQPLPPSIERPIPITVYDFVLMEGDRKLLGKFNDKFDYNFDLYDTNGNLYGKGNTNNSRFVSLYTDSRRHFHRGDNPEGTFVSWGEGEIKIEKGEFTLESIVEENPDQ